MLMTSMSCAMAQSIASTTTLVEPSQPNTLTAYRSAFGATPGPMMKFAGLMAAAVYGPV